MTYSGKLYAGEFVELTYILNYDEKEQRDIEFDLEVYRIKITEKPDTELNIFVITDHIDKAMARAMELFDEMKHPEDKIFTHRLQIQNIEIEKINLPWVFIEKEPLTYHPYFSQTNESE